MPIHNELYSIWMYLTFVILQQYAVINLLFVLFFLLSVLFRLTLVPIVIWQNNAEKKIN